MMPDLHRGRAFSHEGFGYSVRENPLARRPTRFPLEWQARPRKGYR